MERAIAGLAALVASAVVASGLLAGAAHAAPSPLPAAQTLHPGDKLAYDLAIEVQLHVQPSGRATQAPSMIDTTVQGSESMTVLSADADGTLHASLNVSVNVRANGQSQPVQRIVLLKIAPDQSVSVENGGDQTMAQYLAAINQAQKIYGNRTLRVGDKFHQVVNLPGAVPIAFTTSQNVTAEKPYRGYPTFAIAMTGSGPINATIAGTKMTGKMSAAGTTYYDVRDQLFVGSAVRVNVDALMAGAQGGRLTMIETTNVVLRSFTHGAPPTAVPVPSVTATAVAPSASPSPVPTPSPEYFTPTPAAPTPSPVVVPYPPKPPTTRA